MFEEAGVPAFEETLTWHKLEAEEAKTYIRLVRNPRASTSSQLCQYGVGGV